MGGGRQQKRSRTTCLQVNICVATMTSGDATGRECLYEEFEVFAVLRVRTCCCWWRQEERALER